MDGRGFENYHGEKIPGSFYEQELQKTKQKISGIEKIINNNEIKVFIHGWGSMIRLTLGLITKTLTNYRGTVQCSQLRCLDFTGF